ncbi:MAG: hypothetical protein HDR02_07660 [Lachnospiraceae bacterium]|nr:hypothetical protein [Lachnospiraceae bacterium]
MKKVGNSKEKKGMKKRTIICITVSAVVILTAIACIMIFINGNKRNGQDDVMVASNEEATPAPSPTSIPDPTSTPTPEVTPSPAPEVTPSPANDNIVQIISYTSIECDEDSLKKLVIDTMNGMNERMLSYSDESDEFKAVVISIQEHNFLHSNQLVGTADIEGVDGIEGLTWLDICGCVGTVVFDAMDDSYLHPGNYHSGTSYLAHMVAYGLYETDVKSESLDVQAGNEHSFEVSGEMFDVNFEAYFEHDGVKYVALIGNVDNAYKVLDIVNADDLEGEIPAIDESLTAQNGNGGGQNSSGDTPSANPENTASNHSYDNQQGNNDVPELSGDPSTWPCIPGYEYKPGTEYVYPLGWITNNGGTGTTQTGSDMPAWEPCVYDENGNCVLHEHSGY